MGAEMGSAGPLVVLRIYWAAIKESVALAGQRVHHPTPNNFSGEPMMSPPARGHSRSPLDSNQDTVVKRGWGQARGLESVFNPGP